MLEKVVDRIVMAVNEVLRARMERWGFTHARIRPGFDHDGDPVLFIDAEYKLMPEPLDPRVTFGLISEVRRALERLGETRFPHVRHRFDPRQTTMKYP